MGGGVDAQVGIRSACEWPAASAPALVEENNSPGIGIEEASLARTAA
jgi:hypothetical protein